MIFFTKYLNIVEVITGGARGADSIAAAVAEELQIKSTVYPVSKEDWERYGKRAGMLRNESMLKIGQPDLVMAFPGGNGTAHMTQIARKAGVEVWTSKRVLFNSDSKETSFLSNFHEGFEIVDDDGVIWPTSEHLYQAEKTIDEAERQAIYQSGPAWKAKELGKSVTMTTDWEPPKGESFGGRKEEAMRYAIRCKFPRGSQAAEKLLATNDDYLIHHAPWGDSYWGVDRYLRGQNRQGKLLMEWRSTLAQELMDAE